MVLGLRDGPAVVECRRENVDGDVDFERGKGSRRRESVSDATNVLRGSLIGVRTEYSVWRSSCLRIENCELRKGNLSICLTVTQISSSDHLGDDHKTRKPNFYPTRQSIESKKTLPMTAVSYLCG